MLKRIPRSLNWSSPCKRLCRRDLSQPAHIEADGERATLQRVGASSPSPTTLRRGSAKSCSASPAVTAPKENRLSPGAFRLKTVETHRAQLMDRLQIRDIAGLVKYASATASVTTANIGLEIKKSLAGPGMPLRYLASRGQGLPRWPPASRS